MRFARLSASHFPFGKADTLWVGFYRVPVPNQDSAEFALSIAQK